MFGSILGSLVKVATLPIDVVDITLDVATGGDGSKRSRKNSLSPLTMVTDIRDAVVDELEEL